MFLDIQARIIAAIDAVVRLYAAAYVHVLMSERGK